MSTVKEKVKAIMDGKQMQQLVNGEWRDVDLKDVEFVEKVARNINSIRIKPEAN